MECVLDSDGAMCISPEPEFVPNEETENGWVYYVKEPISESELIKDLYRAKTEGTVDEMTRSICEVFGDYRRFGQSFLKVDQQQNAMAPNRKEELRQLQGEQKDFDSTSQFEEPQPHIEVDIESFHRSITLLLAESKDLLSELLHAALVRLAGKISSDLERYRIVVRAYERNLMFNALLLSFEIHSTQVSKYGEIVLPRLAEAMAMLPMVYHARLARTWALYSHGRMKDLLDNCHDCINWRLDHFNLAVRSDGLIQACAKLIRIIYYTSLLFGKIVGGEYEQETSPIYLDELAHMLKVDPTLCREPLIAFRDFVNEKLSDALDLPQDYDSFLHEFIWDKSNGYITTNPFTYLSHPYILSTAIKSEALQYYRREEMFSEQKMSFLILRVRRENITSDTFFWLDIVTMCSPESLKRQLVIEFVGERGIDVGGISNEFFELITQDIFKLEYGLFLQLDECDKLWFNSMSFESDRHYLLIGTLIGLALYNQVILELRFPSVLYRKLFGQKGRFSDLIDLSPTIYNSLLSMMQYDGDDFEDVYLQSFRISSRDVFGNIQYHDLIRDGANSLVTRENCKEFAELYADFLLNKSIEKQFNAFYKGFRMVVASFPISLLLRPDEMEELMVGSNIWDISALEESTSYYNYTPETPIIRHFWEVVREFDALDQRKLLNFITGTHCVPLGGLSKICLAISKGGYDANRLPTAQTCFNVLYLPDYGSKENLREKLKVAIRYSYGFGLK